MSRGSLRHWWLGVGLVAGVFISLVATVVGSLIVASRLDVRETRALRQRLLMQTDHLALAAALRETIGRRGQYRPNPDVAGGDPETRKLERPDPRDPTLPQAIRDLRPADIFVEQDSAMIMFATWSYRFFIEYVAPGANEAHVEHTAYESAREIAPCLWYYEVAEK